MLASETIELRGGRRQTVYRAGEGPTVVWLHGGDGVHDGHPLIEALAQHHTVVAPLAPGFTDLAELEGLTNVHELAMHYDDIFEALDLEGATVIGHSFGGMVAAELAAHYPRRVEQLVLIAPIGLWNDAYPVTDFFAVIPRDLPKLLYADPSAVPGSAEEPDMDQLVAQARGMSTVARFVWPIPDKGLAQRLDRIRARTLVVFGEADAIVPPRYADDFVAGIPNATKSVIAGAGHMLPVERPEQLVDVIESFLTAVAPAT